MMVHLITGGSGSGKSEYAEEMACRCRKGPGEKLVYVATMYPYGEETKMKIRRHRQMREGKGFETVECYTGLARVAGRLEAYGSVTVLIECISNLVSNGLYGIPGRLSDNSFPQSACPALQDNLPRNQSTQSTVTHDFGTDSLQIGTHILRKAVSGQSAADEILRGIEAIRRAAGNVVVVTNEVNSEGLEYGPEMIRYKQVMGEVNCRLALLADRVTEVVYGIAVEVKNRL